MSGKGQVGSVVTRAERHHFQAMFRKLDADGDGDGVIEQVDVDQTLQEMLPVPVPAPPGTPTWRRVTALGDRLWEELLGAVDEDGDRTVTAREFTAAYRRSDVLDRFAVPFELAVLETADADNDGRISPWRSG